MKLYKSTTISIFIICIVSLVIAFYLNIENNEFLKDLCIGIFSSGLILVVGSWIGYRIEFKNHMKMIAKTLSDITEIYISVRLLSNDDKINQAKRGYEYFCKIDNLKNLLIQINEKTVYFRNSNKYQKTVNEIVNKIEINCLDVTENSKIITYIPELFGSESEEFIQKAILIKKREIFSLLYKFELGFLRQGIYFILENLDEPVRFSEISVLAAEQERIPTEYFSSDLEPLRKKVEKFDEIFK